MSLYETSDKDIEIVIKLINVSNHIGKIHIILRELEKNDQKYSDEYNKWLGYLKTMLETEEDLWNKIHGSYKKITEISAAILFLNGNEEYKEKVLLNEDSLIFNDDNCILTRMLGIGLKKTYSTYELFKEGMLGQQETLKSTTEIDESRIKGEYINLLLDNSIKEDIIRNFLILLDEAIEKERNIDIKKRLIDFKYYIFQTKSNIGKSFIIDLKDDKTMYSSNQFVSGIYGISDFKRESIVENIVKKEGFLQIAEIVDISNIDYNEINKSTEAIIRIVYLNAVLLCLSESELQEFKERVFNIINSKDFQKFIKINNISLQLITNLFRKVSNEKPMVNKITFLCKN